MIKKEQIQKFLLDAGIYSELDEYLIDQFIIYLEMIQQAKEDIETNGITIESTRTGFLQKAPAVTILNDCTKYLNAISKKLGLSPADRKALQLQLYEEDGF